MAGSDSSQSPARSGRKTRPTGGARLAVSPGGEKGAGPERAERRGERAGGEEKGGAPVGPKQKKTASEKGRKEEKKERWAGLKVGIEKEKGLYFSKAILTLSIQIQTQRFEFKLNNKQIKKMQSGMRCTNLFSLHLFYS